MKNIKAVVVSNKMEKTVVVAVETLKPHKVYQKRLKQTKKLKAHSDLEVSIGDTVLISATRPYSGQTNFKVVEVIKDIKGK